MKEINVIDLDKTLLPYDSFRIILKKELYKFNLSIMFYSLMRILKLINGANFKKEVSKNLERKYDDVFFKNLAVDFSSDFNDKVLNIIRENSKDGSVNILLSASPNCYVKHILNYLKWEGTGSYFNDAEKFIHMFGENKIKWIERKYPISNYEYNFAISDSHSDDDLLKLFKTNILWTSL